jgi:hypothetical protein
MAEIQGRIEQLDIERAYRIVGMLTHTARAIQERWAPKLKLLGKEWRHKVLVTDAVLAGVAVVLLLILSLQQGWWNGMALALPFEWSVPLLGGVALVSMASHFGVRRWMAERIIKRLRSEGGESPSSEVEGMVSAFTRNTRPWFSIFHPFPVGWNLFSRKKITQVLLDADQYIQSLNDRFTDPSGKKSDEAE